MIKKLFIYFVCFYFLFFSFMFLTAEEFHVTNGDEFQAALTEAGSNNEENVIFMASGIYYRTNETGEHYANFRYREETQANSLTIRGEEGTSALDVIIDANGSGWCLYISSGPLEDHIEDPEINIYGITFQNGNSLYYTAGLEILCIEFKITVSNCIIENNITACDFNSGGVMIKGKSICLENNKVLRNTSLLGSNDYSYLRSGGLYLTVNRDDIILKNNIIAYNTANSEIDSSYPFFSCVGGIYIECYNNATVSLINNTIFRNVADKGGGLYFYGPNEAIVKLYNNIFYNNTANLYPHRGDVYCEDENVKIYAYHNNYTNFDFAGSFEESVNNVDIDPGLECPISGDFHLTADSPMIDAGTVYVPAPPGLPEHDFEGDTRTYGSIPDIGADEYIGNMYIQWSFLRARWLFDKEILGPKIFLRDLDTIKMRALVSCDDFNQDVEIWIVQTSKEGINYLSEKYDWSDKKTAFYQGTINKDFEIEISKFIISKSGLYNFYVLVDKKIDGKITSDSMELDYKVLYITDEQQEK